jgi:seryl-tRNA(Sec) selenium transferase
MTGYVKVPQEDWDAAQRAMRLQRELIGALSALVEEFERLNDDEDEISGSIVLQNARAMLSRAEGRSP